MLPFYTFEFVLTVVFAIVFYRAGVFERDLAMSVAVSLAIWQWLDWGLLAMMLGQLALLVGIGVFRVTPAKADAPPRSSVRVTFC